MAKIQLITPRNNWKNPLWIDQSQVPVLREIAKRNGMLYNYNKAQGKVYLDRGDGARGKEREGVIKLPTPYYSQRDSKSGHASRMCFSSSCAMLLATLKPGALSGSSNADDEYLQRVFKFGDTTSSSAQVQALKHFGIDASFRTNLSWDDMEAQIKAGVPMPIGILHWGPIEAPEGDGHWICAIGMVDEDIIVHDPFGELDLVAGAYLHSDGNARRYSRKNLAKRWMVEGAGSGWGIVVKP